MIVYVVCVVNREGDSSVQVFASLKGAEDYARERVQRDFYKDGHIDQSLPEDLIDQLLEFEEDLGAHYVSQDFGSWDCPIQQIWMDTLEVRP